MSESKVAPDAKPKLPRGVRLTHNEAQGGWVLLAPERVFKADAIAAEIVKRCTGDATLADGGTAPLYIRAHEENGHVEVAYQGTPFP